MPTQINGLPAHVLLIHLVIAAVPLAALFVVLHALWPAARRRLGIVTPLVALVALVFVPVTTNAGEWLQRHINATGELEKKINHHADLGHTLLPLVIILFVVAVAVWLLGRRYEYGLVPDRAATVGGAPDGPTDSGSGTAVRTQTRPVTRTALPTWANAVIGIGAVAIAVINVVQLYRIGDAGAQSVWGH